nr:hypothetical protein 9 [Piscirickettsiaceae bacterium]
MDKNLLKPYKEKAELLGCDDKYLMQIANGHRHAPPWLCLKINELLDVPLWEIRPEVYPRSIFENAGPESQVQNSEQSA